MERSTAPSTLQARTDAPPGTTVGGVALKELMTGARTVTVVLAVTLPEAFVAVRV
jgi:hypothetical protein